MRKKIGIIIPTLSKAGAEKVAAQLSLLLGDSYEVKYFLLKNKVDYDYIGQVHILKTHTNKFVRMLMNIKEMKKIKKSEEIDVFISFLEIPNIINILTKTKNTKTILSVRNFISLEYEHYKFGKLIKSVVRLTYNYADKIVVVSDKIKEDLIRSFGIKKDLITTIYNPIDFQRINNLSMEDSFEVKGIKEWKENSILFINVGRLEYQKNQKDFINIIYLLIRHKVDVKGIILGDGSKREELREHIKSKGLEDKVKILGHKNNPYPYIAQADVYLLTSYFEGFPNSLLEAMALKKYVISTNCLSGPQEILSTDIINSSSKYGLLLDDLYRNKITDDMVVEIKKVINDRELRENTVAKYDQLLRKYRFQKIQRDWIDIINEK